MDKELEIALELERIALADDYFIARKLYPNVDFYTGLIYRSMAFPTDFFTVLFAVARTRRLAGAVGGDADWTRSRRSPVRARSTPGRRRGTTPGRSSNYRPRLSALGARRSALGARRSALGAGLPAGGGV